MNKEEIQKAFEGRWRLKADFGKINNNSATMSFDEFYEYLRDMCFDFFEAGVILAGRDIPPQVKKPDYPLAQDEVLLCDFDTWWNLYDLKCGRGNCEKKWAKLTPKEKADCIAATPAYVASTPDKQFRKRPLTYLNQKAFYDEIIIRHTPEQQRQQRLTEVAERIAGYTKAAK